ncbi:hypothetical protein HMPREF1324_1147 [Rothia aeria F0474]|uniref:Uncharacterized protein n=1 Tax=Rothia aeria F0474 TaxID=1125724 RepID=I0URT7_9MICC|nr:hypothetical protein HMPREF1324_1147 [Rothia aeria F0474]
MPQCVFPAYVGMSPTPAKSQKVVQRVPRIRGDEPQSSSEALGLGKCSPHTWG